MSQLPTKEMLESQEKFKNRTLEQVASDEKALREELLKGFGKGESTRMRIRIQEEAT